MSEVTRHEYSAHYGMEQKPDGDYVWYDDYKDLEQENQQQAETIRQLEQQTREKEARIARLEKAFWELTDYAENSIDTPISAVEDAENVLNETPQQSLAHIQAEAVDSFITAAIQLGELPNSKAVCDKIRQQADKG